jgi:hypothetical protein
MLSKRGKIWNTRQATAVVLVTDGGTYGGLLLDILSDFRKDVSKLLSKPEKRYGISAAL